MTQTLRGIWMSFVLACISSFFLGRGVWIFTLFFMELSILFAVVSVYHKLLSFSEKESITG